MFWCFFGVYKNLQGRGGAWRADKRTNTQQSLCLILEVQTNLILLMFYYQFTNLFLFPLPFKREFSDIDIFYIIRKFTQECILMYSLSTELLDSNGSIFISCSMKKEKFSDGSLALGLEKIRGDQLEIALTKTVSLLCLITCFLALVFSWLSQIIREMFQTTKNYSGWWGDNHITS